MKKYAFIIMILSFLLSCDKADRRKVITNDSNNDELNSEHIKKDSNYIDMAKLPIYIDSTDYLIHPIGRHKINKQRSEYLSGDNFYSGNNASSYKHHPYGIEGDLSNIMFQHIHSEKLTALTNSKLSIVSMAFLFDIFESAKKGYYVYDVIDKDTNLDGELDTNDLKSLYISNADGTNFQKITSENQDLAAWKSVAIKNRLYFNTIEDFDGNGLFNKKDKMHYFYINLSEEQAKPVEYFPV